MLKLQDWHIYVTLQKINEHGITEIIIVILNTDCKLNIW